MELSSYLIAFTYPATITLLLLLMIVYWKKFEGLWPPHSRVVFTLSWIWYTSIYFTALWLSFLESSMPFKGLIWQIMGMALITIGSLIMVWAFMAFRSARRVMGERVDTLVTSGPYRYVRNPQYVGSIIILLGITLIQSSFHLLIFTMLQAAIFHILALLEERALEKKFGKKYLEYKRKTPRYL